MKFSYLLTCMVFLLVSLKGFGQDTTGLSLPRLWEQAFANYPSLEAYRSQQRQANINQKLTRNQYLPNVLLQAQNTMGTQHGINGAFFPLPGLFNVNGAGINSGADYAANMFGSVVMDWQFMQFGRQKKSMEAAAVLSNQAAHRLNAEQVAVQAALSRDYFQLLYYQRMQHWAQANTQRLQTIFQASAANARAGLSPGADSLLIKATLDQTGADLHKWQGFEEEAKIALAQWVNIPASHLTVQNELFLNEGEPHLIRETEQDLATHPQLAFKKEQIAYAEKQKELAFLGALPSLSILGGVQLRGHSMNRENSVYENWGQSYNNTADNYLVGLGLTWNLGQAFDSRLEKSLYLEEAQQRQAETEALALNLRSQKEMAQQQMAQSRQQIDNTEQAYEAASQAYGLFEARYNSGLISITELLQIQDILQNTERTRIEAYYQYWLQQTNMAESTADFSYLQNVFE